MSCRFGFEDFPVEELSEIGHILEGKDNRCSAKQRQWIHSMLEELGMSEREALSEIGKEFLADEFESPLREMTLSDASELIDFLKPLFYDSKNNRDTYSNRSLNNKISNMGGWF